MSARPDAEARRLDFEILRFIKKHQDAKASGEEAFRSLALKIFRYQFEENPNYRKYCLLTGTGPGIRDWKDIPAMPTLGFKELVLASFPIKKAVKVFRTSGTTQNGRGSPSERRRALRPMTSRQARGAHFFDTLKLYEAAIIPSFREYLLPDGRRLDYFFLIASPKEAPDSSLSHMMGVVNRAFAKNKGRFCVRKGDVLHDKLLSDLKKVRPPVFILATAFSLKGFLDFLKSRKISLKLPPGSRLMETGGFKGRAREISKAALYGECEKRLGIRRDFCVSEYGMTELSSQCYDTTLLDRVKGLKRRSFKVGPAWMRTLVIDPRTGKEARKGMPGLLRHFDLANRGSVLAIQTEDIGCAGGGGFELIGRAPDSELRGCSLSYEEFLSERR